MKGFSQKKYENTEGEQIQQVFDLAVGTFILLILGSGPSFLIIVGSEPSLLLIFLTFVPGRHWPQARQSRLMLSKTNQHVVVFFFSSFHKVGTGRSRVNPSQFCQKQPKTLLCCFVLLFSKSTLATGASIRATCLEKQSTQGFVFDVVFVYQVDTGRKRINPGKFDPKSMKMKTCVISY